MQVKMTHQYFNSSHILLNYKIKMSIIVQTNGYCGDSLIRFLRLEVKTYVTFTQFYLIKKIISITLKLALKNYA